MAEPINVPEEKKTVNVMSLNKQFQEFKGEVNDALGKIVNMLEQKTPAEQAKVEEAKQAEPPEGTYGTLTPQYEVVFAKYFDRKDGFMAEMDYLTRNAFAIFIPKKFSNATSAYLDFYKNDIRTKILKGDDILNGMEDWCKLVARNLHYDKNKVTK